MPLNQMPITITEIEEDARHHIVVDEANNNDDDDNNKNNRGKPKRKKNSSATRRAKSKRKPYTRKIRAATASPTEALPLVMVVQPDGGFGIYEKVSDNYNSGSNSGSNEVTFKHNYLERKRRVHLKQSFDKLRHVLPSLNTSDKASKVVILSAAIKEITSLKARERMLLYEKQELTIAQEALRNRLVKHA